VTKFMKPIKKKSANNKSIQVHQTKDISKKG
jgi:hypothetical protein